MNAHMDICQYTLSVEIPYGLVIVSSPNYDHDYCFKIGNSIISGKFVKYHDSGNKWRENNYKNCKRDGLEISLYENGNKESQYNYKNDKLEGLGVYWNYDGKIWVENNYKNDMRGELSTVWHKYSTKMSERVYRGTTLVYEKWHE